MDIRHLYAIRHNLPKTAHDGSLEDKGRTAGVICTNAWRHERSKKGAVQTLRNKGKNKKFISRRHDQVMELAWCGDNGREQVENKTTNKKNHMINNTPSSTAAKECSMSAKSREYFGGKFMNEAYVNGKVRLASKSNRSSKVDERLVELEEVSKEVSHSDLNSMATKVNKEIDKRKNMPLHMQICTILAGTTIIIIKFGLVVRLEG